MRDNAPIGNTCPNIDAAQNSAEDAVSNLSETIVILNDWIKALEGLRQENATLRDWGNKEYARAESAEQELGYLKKEIPKLEDEIDSLKSEIKWYENRVNNITND